MLAASHLLPPTILHDPERGMNSAGPSNTAAHTPGISSQSSRSTLSRQDDLLNLPAATEAFRQREPPPTMLDDDRRVTNLIIQNPQCYDRCMLTIVMPLYRLTAFPFPLQRSPQRSPMFSAILDDLMQYREAQSSPKPIIGQRFPKSV